MRLQLVACLFGMTVAVGAASSPAPADMLLAPDTGKEILVIRGLIKTGSIDQATTRLERIAEAQTLFDVRTLRVFEPLWNDTRAQAHLRPEDFAERHIATARAKSQQNAKDPEARMLLVRALAVNGRFDEAVETAQETLRNLSSYRRVLGFEGWVRNYLAHALISRGECEAANAALRPMARVASRRDVYASTFSINFALMLLHQGHYDEARNAARTAERGLLTDFGRSLIRFIDVCAMRGLGQDAAAEMAMESAIQTPGQFAPITFETLLCLDRFDQAATLLTTMLGDDGLREPALRALQDCVPNPKLPQFTRDYHAKRMALRERPDVKQAIAIAGVVITRPQTCGWF